MIDYHMAPSLIMADAGKPPDAWQEAVLYSRSKRILLLCARQVGKTCCIATRTLHRLLFNDKYYVQVFYPGERQAIEFLDAVRELYEAIGRPKYKKDGINNQSTMSFANGSKIRAQTSNEATGRGPSANLLIIDEASYVDDSIYYTNLPKLAVTDGDVILLSTPNGCRGFFFKEWTEGEGWERTIIRADQCSRFKPSTEVFLAEMRQKTSERLYKQEYECDFSDPIEAVFGAEYIARLYDSEVQPLFI